MITKYGKEFSIVEVPYCLKLLMHELTAMNVQMRLITADTIDSLTTAGKRSLGEFKTWATKPLETIQETIPKKRIKQEESDVDSIEKQKMEQVIGQPISNEEFKLLSDEPLEEYEPPITLSNLTNPAIGKDDLSVSQQKNPIPVQTIKYESKPEADAESKEAVKKIEVQLPDMVPDMKEDESSLSSTSSTESIVEDSESESKAVPEEAPAGVKKISFKI
jgi:hypothetical protein